jgi:hypothetical protein
MKLKMATLSTILSLFFLLSSESKKLKYLLKALLFVTIHQQARIKNVWFSVIYKLKTFVFYVFIYLQTHFLRTLGRVVK